MIQSTAFDAQPSTALSLGDGTTLTPDRCIFACGPWLAQMFPRTVGPHFTSTRQDVFFFGTPANDARYNEGNLPVWADHGDRFMYGIPGNEGRGFKLADDTRGPEFDPTSGERIVSPNRLAQARHYLAYRFPGMKAAPLLETRVCQYEDTTDHNFIVDRHPENPNLWIVGGGSGHGFKHGPALGEMVAQLILKDGIPISNLPFGALCEVVTPLLLCSERSCLICPRGQVLPAVLSNYISFCLASLTLSP